MDKRDLTIIRLLQQNARMPVKDIAKEVFLSSPAVSARIERLEKNGVIKGFHAQIDAKKLGYAVTAFIDLKMQPEQKPSFYPFISGVQNVLECSCVTGDYSMHIKAAFQTTAELDTFIVQLQHFGQTSTKIVFSTSVGPREIPV